MGAPSEREPQSQATGPLSGAGAARRRLLKGGAAATPVLLTLSSKTAMATGNCTAASAFASLNASRPDVLKSCTGKYPSWWKSCHVSYWPTAYPQNKLWRDCGLNTSSAFSSGSTLLQVVNFTETSGHKYVAAHIAAALLNAKCGWTPGDVLGEARVKTLWNEFCSQNFVVPTAGVKWYDVHPTVVVGASPGGVVGYIRTTMV